jgi:hypothetical protein
MIPYVREIDIEYGRCDQVSPLIRPGDRPTIRALHLQGHRHLHRRQGEVAVIDPGPGRPAHLARSWPPVRRRDGQPHPDHPPPLDHSPLAGPLKARTGAPISGCAVAETRTTPAR